ncbi:hypothetical protein HOG98_00620 [bacterium]|jgi:hypothetical protein|nr:hypothetical protein [bacterium]
MIKSNPVTNGLSKLIKGIVISSLILLSSCNTDDSTPSSSKNKLEPQSTWDSVQTIFSSKCISCHRSGRRHAATSGLILTHNMAYESLVDTSPKNEQALLDGFKRVSTSGNAEERLSKSFLWKKVQIITNSAYGKKMPTRGSLTSSEIAIIKSWIESGALKD